MRPVPTTSGPRPARPHPLPSRGRRRRTAAAPRASPPASDGPAFADLPTLPPLSTPRSLTLVRHGQSTWNAAGIIQGSSDVSRLTDKGRAQAAATRDAV